MQFSTYYATLAILAGLSAQVAAMPISSTGAELQARSCETNPYGCGLNPKSNPDAPDKRDLESKSELDARSCETNPAACGINGFVDNGHVVTTGPIRGKAKREEEEEEGEDAAEVDAAELDARSCETNPAACGINGFVENGHVVTTGPIRGKAKREEEEDEEEDAAELDARSCETNPAACGNNGFVQDGHVVVTGRIHG